LRDPFTFAIHEAEVVLRPGELAVGGARWHHAKASGKLFAV
jgi:hypothetical protein